MFWKQNKQKIDSSWYCGSLLDEPVTADIDEVNEFGDEHKKR